MTRLLDSEVLALFEQLDDNRTTDEPRLKLIHDYLRGTQISPAVPTGARLEVKNLAQIARVNIMDIVVSAIAQTLYIDGYRQKKEKDNAPAWESWQLNKLDARQVAVHRAALTYGVSYVTVVPGDTGPAIRGFSPRHMTTLYVDSADWPEAALSCKDGILKVWHRSGIYVIERGTDTPPKPQVVDFLTYGDNKDGVENTPVVRFLNVQDLDEDNLGEVEPLIHLQDQIDITTFGLLVAQHYSAFRQRYIIGWTADSETELLKASANRILTFDDSPEDIKIGEFEQTNLDGYLESRESSLRHAATLSQTPVHELIGQMVNLSAEALVAAEAGQRRKVVERQTSLGESWEQVFELAAIFGNFEVDPEAQVRWRDTESRALASTVDALGKMATMLGVPVQMLWEFLPNVSQADLELWKIEFKKNDSIQQMNDLLGKQIDTQTPLAGGGSGANASGN